MVEDVLITSPKSRESDQYLTLTIWARYYTSKLRIDELGKKWIKLSDIMDLPREDAVKRIRAKFNEKGQYLPTNPKVIKQRRLNISKWKNTLKLI